MEVPRKLPGRLRLGWPSIVVLGVAIALAVAGYVIALGEVRDREERLLREQATQTAAIIGSFARQIEAILYAGSVVADVTGGDPATFASRMSERLEGTAISSITLLSLGSSGPTVLADAGTSPLLVSGFDPYDQERLEEIAASGDLRVVKIATVEAGKVVGFAASGGRGNLAVYAESVVPALDNIFLFRPAKGSDYALYLGSSQSPETLLASSTDDLPLEGTTVTQELDLGDETGLIVVGAAGGLVGGLTRWAPWVTVVAVALLAVGVALVLELRRRRQSSEAATRALAEQNERLREVDRLKDELVAIVSHELRTPLTSVLGYLELLREDATELTQEHRGFIVVIERNARRLLNLVGDLLFVARVDAGGLRLELEEVDLQAVVTESIEAQRPRAARAGVGLFLTTEPAPPIPGDGTRLGQLLDNLVSNAVKFTPAGGRVDVTLSKADDAVEIVVSDTGIGIRAAEQARVFERFFRSPAATAGAIQGTGLGLTIAKAIVDAHDGTIDLSSEEGAGTTVRVRLPLETVAGRPAEASVLVA